MTQSENPPINDGEKIARIWQRKSWLEIQEGLEKGDGAAAFMERQTKAASSLIEMDKLEKAVREKDSNELISLCSEDGSIREASCKLIVAYNLIPIITEKEAALVLDGRTHESGIFERISSAMEETREIQARINARGELAPPVVFSKENTLNIVKNPCIGIIDRRYLEYLVGTENVELAMAKYDSELVLLADLILKNVAVPFRWRLRWPSALAPIQESINYIGKDEFAELIGTRIENPPRIGTESVHYLLLWVRSVLQWNAEMIEEQLHGEWPLTLLDIKTAIDTLGKSYFVDSLFKSIKETTDAVDALKKAGFTHKELHRLKDKVNINPGNYIGILREAAKDREGRNLELVKPPREPAPGEGGLSDEQIAQVMKIADEEIARNERERTSLLPPVWRARRFSLAPPPESSRFRLMGKGNFEDDSQSPEYYALVNEFNDEHDKRREMKSMLLEGYSVAAIYQTWNLLEVFLTRMYAGGDKFLKSLPEYFLTRFRELLESKEQISDLVVVNILNEMEI